MATPTTPQGGYMLRLERDAAGHLRAVPDTMTYHQMTGAPDLPPDASDATSDADTHGRPWRIWRATDPEPGAAPAFASFDHLARALWFGESLAEDTPDNDAACRGAWARLCNWIAVNYPGCHAKQTPGATGLALVQHTLPWGKGQRRPYVYPTLPADLARLLAATAPQHRMELLTVPGATMRRYTQYDARIAHAAYLRHLPVLLGEDTSSLIHDDGPYIPYRAGKYRVSVTVPQGWAHIGLVHRAVTGKLGATWDYPATPGDEWETWLDAGEVALLAKNDIAPWPFAVRERILWADGKTPGTDPLREHSERITNYLERLDRERSRPDLTSALTPAQALELAALRHAARAVALHPIGLWHKSSNQRPRHIDSLDELTPADAEATIVPAEHGGYTVTNSAALSGYQAHWRRVEWSTTIYARERVYATRRALTAPRASVLGIRGDACHFADYAPDWPDTGKVGAYRLKVDLAFNRARRAPQTDDALLALAQEGE